MTEQKVVSTGWLDYQTFNGHQSILYSQTNFNCSQRQISLVFSCAVFHSSYLHFYSGKFYLYDQWI